MEATTNPTTAAQLLGLPEKSAEFFAALAADAGNWSGYPWLSGNVQPGRSSSGMSQTLVRAGLIDVNEDDGDAYASFTEAGCAAAAKLGFDLYDFYGYERPAAEVAETPAEPVAETPAPAGKSMTCPECGFAFKSPQARCNSRSACAKRAAARQGTLPLADPTRPMIQAGDYAFQAVPVVCTNTLPGVAEIVAKAEVRTAAQRAATPVSTPAEIAEMRREDAAIARAEITEPAAPIATPYLSSSPTSTLFGTAAAYRSEPRSFTERRPVADWLDRNPADVLAEYVEELRSRHAEAIAEGSVIEPALAAQVAEQERSLAWVRARQAK